MKHFLSNAILFAAASWAGPIVSDDSTDSPSTSSTAGPGTKSITSTNNGDLPGFPLDGHHLSAPVSNIAVPADNKTFTPSTSTISGKELDAWMKQESTNDPPASKFFKIAPGAYSIDCNDNLVFSFMGFKDNKSQGWTIDMRYVTFTVNGGCQAIYLNQVEDFTILGGTLWFDQGDEIWTQSKIQSIEDAEEGHAIVTSVVEEGYNVSTWRNAGPRTMSVMDTSDEKDYYRPTDINFWFASEWNFDQLDSKKTWTMKISKEQVPLKVGYILGMTNGLGNGNTIGSEYTGNLHVDGFTTNGALSQYGLSDKKTATFENVWYVNEPARPGSASRAFGPTMSFGHVQWFDYNTPGQPNITYVNSKWMTTGSENDLQDAGDQNLHDGGY